MGDTVAKCLTDIGITDETELRKIGAANAYKQLSTAQPNQRLPVCYYLYSLEGAIQNIHWSDMPENDKTKLRLAAGLSK
ncbi:MAG: TfoX/Sxy family DNA transformation protein [Thiotrichales bacterium]|nr:TfoX/Sxy family DNA transformation protein [Thiotrichales bacterium]